LVKTATTGCEAVSRFSSVVIVQEHLEALVEAMLIELRDESSVEEIQIFESFLEAQGLRVSLNRVIKHVNLGISRGILCCQRYL
jgi:hypothetical protein